MEGCSCCISALNPLIIDLPCHSLTSCFHATGTCGCNTATHSQPVSCLSAPARACRCARPFLICGGLCSRPHARRPSSGPFNGASGRPILVGPCHRAIRTASVPRALDTAYLTSFTATGFWCHPSKGRVTGPAQESVRQAAHRRNCAVIVHHHRLDQSASRPLFNASTATLPSALCRETALSPLLCLLPALRKDFLARCVAASAAIRRCRCPATRKAKKKKTSLARQRSRA